MSMQVIEHIEVGSGGAASITFSSIPDTYTDLMILLSTRAAESSTELELNGSSSGFSYRRLYAVPSVGSSSAANNFIGQLNNFTTYTANTFSNSQIYFPNYASNSAKSYSVEATTENNASDFLMNLLAGLWTGTDPITSIKLTPASAASFVQYSSATLYGIRKYNTTSSPKATGGIISYVNGYWVHTFTASGTFTPSENLTAEYLVVAGGGGGGGYGAGGGAGGFKTNNLALTGSTNYTVTIGGGGSGGANQGSNGSNSIFSTITSTGGGFGAGVQGTVIGGNGGSGGGGAGGNPPNSGGTGISGEGNDGGAGDTDSSTYTTSGGGGGSSSVGGDASSSAGGNGGTGSSSSITGTSLFYSGGGGAAGFGLTSPPKAAGTGGSGVGGDGGLSANGASGTINRGGGGGGGDFTYFGGSGGSGIVIVRYAA